MITYEQAKKKAVGIRPALDSALEYKDAYLFYNSKARGTKTDDNEVIVLKKSGNIISMTEYVMSTSDNSSPKQIKF